MVRGRFHGDNESEVGSFHNFRDRPKLYSQPNRRKAKHGMTVNGGRVMSYVTDQEQIVLRALAQEIEDGTNTRCSVSRALARTINKDPTQQDFTVRLGAILDPQAARAASQLGPWDTGYITFSGVAVGGYANLTLYPNGAFNFSGHFHVSGGISYNDSFVWAVRDSNVPPTIYVFAHQGRLHGTFESGSRDDDWGRSEVNPALAAGWSALERGWSWHWDARLNADFGVFLDDIIKLVAAGQAVGAVVKFFI
jgi:hypothetical protein